jgi:hypothetical protein
MESGYVILMPILAVFLTLIFFFIVVFFIQPNHGIRRSTLPDVPMYYQYCPPPPPQYYLGLEYLESQPKEDEVPQSSKLFDLHC